MGVTAKIVVRITDEATGKRRWVPTNGKILTHRVRVTDEATGKRSWVIKTEKAEPVAPHYLRYCIGSTPQFKSAGDRYDVAFTEKIKLERKLKAAELGAVIVDEPAAPAPPSRHRMTDLVDSYILQESKPDKNGDTRSAKCLNPYRSEVDAFVEWSGKTYVDEVTRKLLTDYRDWLLAVGRDGSPYEVDTARNKLMTLLVVFKNNPIVSIPPILPCDEFPDKKVTIPDPYSREEFDLFMKHADYEDALRIYTFISTGLRDQEAMNAERRDIDWDLGCLYIVKKRDREFKGKNKSARRKVPLNDDLLAELELRPEGLLFPAPRGGVDRHYGERSVRPIAVKAKIKFTTDKAHMVAAGMTKDDPLHRMRDSYITCQLHLHCPDMAKTLELCQRIGHKGFGTLSKYFGTLKHPYEPSFPEHHRKAKNVTAIKKNANVA